MPAMSNLIFIAGLLHVGVLIAAALVPGKLSLRSELNRLPAFTRQLVWIHAGYVAMTVAAMGLVSVAIPGELAGGSAAGRAICGYIAVFWGIRLVLSFWMKPGEHLDRMVFKLGYAALLATFGYFALVYTLAAVGG